MRRGPLLVVGALAFAGASVASGAYAQTEQPPPTEKTTTTRAPTTTSPPDRGTPTTQSTTATTSGGSTATTKPSTGQTTTTLRNGGRPIPPPASGASQPLDPSILGGSPLVTFDTNTTTPFATDSQFGTTTIPPLPDTSAAINVASTHKGPSGATLALAAVAWLASLGGLLVYAEDQRGKHWRHLAR